MSTITIDLTQRPPRSPRVRLGGYVTLPRILDKGRATLAGKVGPYHYNCPLDQRFFNYAGIDAEKMKEQIAAGKGDGEILEWIIASSSTKPTEVEIAAWSDFNEMRVPGDVETKKFFTGELEKLSTTRDDIFTWFEWLDLDDHVSYGGKA